MANFHFRRFLLEICSKTISIFFFYFQAPECVIEIHRRVEEWGRDTAGIVGQSSGAQLFNYVLGNYYADGTENIGQMLTCKISMQNINASAMM